jgi:hypothetical protein
MPNKLGRVKGCTTASNERRDQSTVLGAGPRANWKRVEKSAASSGDWPLGVIFSCQHGINLGLTAGSGPIAASIDLTDKG